MRENGVTVCVVLISLWGEGQEGEGGRSVCIDDKRVSTHSEQRQHDNHTLWGFITG